MASRISHQLWGHGKAQTPPQYLSACVPECPNPRVSRSPWSLQPWYHHPYCHIPGQAQPHPLAPSSLCTHIPVPPSSHSAHNPSVPTSGALIPHPLASFPLGTHILWHRFYPPSGARTSECRPPRLSPCPGAPSPVPPRPPAPRSRPAHPSPGGGGGARCGMRCAPLPPPGSARPRGSPGAVVRQQHPQVPAAGKTPLPSALAPKSRCPAPARRGCCRDGAVGGARG